MRIFKFKVYSPYINTKTYEPIIGASVVNDYYIESNSSHAAIKKLAKYLEDKGTSYTNIKFSKEIEVI